MSCTTTCKDKIVHNDNSLDIDNIINYNKITGNKRVQLLLDLDSTVINSLTLDSELQYLPKDFQEHFTYVDMPKYYRIFERPYLQEFLDYAFREFDVSIMTAADKDYAAFIVEKLIACKPERKINFLFYGYHSLLSENYFDSPKDLRILWQVFKINNFNSCNTIIIDDLPAVYKNNPYNSIPAIKFDLLTPKKKPNEKMIHDSFLLKIIPLLESKRQEFMKTSCINQEQ